MPVNKVKKCKIKNYKNVSYKYIKELLKNGKYRNRKYF